MYHQIFVVLQKRKRGTIVVFYMLKAKVKDYDVMDCNHLTTDL